MRCLTMRVEQGKLQFEVKWKGYDDPSDMTVEPEENLLYYLPRFSF